MTKAVADAALVLGATGRLGKVMLQGLNDLGITPIVATRATLATHAADRTLPPLPERLVLVDASIDYSDMVRHESAKQALVTDLARHHELQLVASFSSGAVDFDDALIANPFYRDYKQAKLDNLAFYRALCTRLFYPKIYTLVGPNSFAVKTTGWVQVFEQASHADDVAIAHPLEPRSWVSESCVRRVFTSFVAGTDHDLLGAPVCGTFRLQDIVAFCEARRGRKVAVRQGQATPWLSVPYVSPQPFRVAACACDLHAQLAALSHNPPAH